MTIRTRHLWLDYANAERKKKVLGSLSTAVMAGRFLWTASDETRTIECLEPTRAGFQLRRQVSLNTPFPHLPGAAKTAKKNEADLESIDVAHGKLWVCGSHCLVREKNERASEMAPPESAIGERPSRELLGRIGLTKAGDDVAGPGEALSYPRLGSLRNLLAKNPFIAPFAGLPSKEGGLDIEGMVVFRNQVFLGLRGPLVANIALVVQLPITPGLKINQADTVTHFLDLGGLAVRDLTRWKDGLLVLAGPSGAADGPFRLYQWQPRKQPRVQCPTEVHHWEPAAEHPEGICGLDRSGSLGLLVLFDSPIPEVRIQGSRYRADWLLGV